MAAKGLSKDHFDFIFKIRLPLYREEKRREEKKMCTALPYVSCWSPFRHLLGNRRR